MINRLRAKLIGVFVLAAVMCAMTVSPSPVADAAMRGDVAQVRTLLKSGADVNAAQGDGMTALHWAAEHGSADMAEILLSAGASVIAVTRIGQYTPLHIASKTGQPKLVQLLLRAGADANAVTTISGATPLHLAAASGSADAVRALLDHGARMDAREAEWGQTPLMFAAAYNRPEAIVVLMERGADATLTTRVVSMTEQAAEDAAAARRRNQVLNAFRPDSQDGWTPTPAQLQAAIAAGRAVYGSNQRAEVVEDQAALADGAVAGYAGQVGAMGGLTALHHAVRQGHIEAAMALLDWGANVNQLSGGDRTTPLLMAAINGQFDIAMRLIERKANPNLVSVAGTGPLYAVINTQWAPRSRYPQPQAVQNQQATYLEVMEALLKAGANPNARLRQHLWYFAYNNCGNSNCGLENLEGSTPFWRAAYSVDVDAMRLLKQHGADHMIPSQRAAGQQRPGGPGGPGGGPPGAGQAAAQRFAALQAQRAGGGTDQAAAAQQQAGARRPGGQDQRQGSAQQGGQQQAGPPQRAQGQQRAAADTQAAGEQPPRPGEEPQRGDPQSLDPQQQPDPRLLNSPVGDGVYVIHAVAGVGYGNGFAANAHRHAPGGWMAAMKYAVEELGMDVNARDANGYTPLHHAAARGDNEMILYLVEKGADVKAVARNGRTTADMANGPVQRLRPFPETVALLVKLGAVNNNRCVSC